MIFVSFSLNYIDFTLMKITFSKNPVFLLFLANVIAK
jgi:hypothetical protein